MVILYPYSFAYKLNIYHVPIKFKVKKIRSQFPTAESRYAVLFSKIIREKNNTQEFRKPEIIEQLVK